MFILINKNVLCCIAEKPPMVAFCQFSSIKDFEVSNWYHSYCRDPSISTAFKSPTNIILILKALNRTNKKNFLKWQGAYAASCNVSKNAPGQQLQSSRLLFLFGSKFDKTLLRCLTHVRMVFSDIFLVLSRLPIEISSYKNGFLVIFLDEKRSTKKSWWGIKMKPNKLLVKK